MSWSNFSTQLAALHSQEQAKRKRRELKRSSKRRKAARSLHDPEDWQTTRSPDQIGVKLVEEADVAAAPAADERKVEQQSSETEDADLADFLTSLLP